MGSIKDCFAAGVPQALLLPILPWDNLNFGEKQAGKMPAYTDGSIWLPLPKWTNGDISPTILDLADENGGNCGLLTGVPDSDYNYIIVDIDFLPGNEVHRERFVNQFATAAGQIIVRETVPYRASLLFNIKDLSGGKKQVYLISLKDGTYIGKVEILAKGQQSVIAGRHHSGNDIRWYRSDNPGVKTRAPDLSDIVTFPSFANAQEAVRRVMEDIGGFGYAISASTVSHDGDAIADDSLAPGWLTPTKLINLIDRMSNPEKLDRDVYVSIMLAISASMHGIRTNAGGISAEEEKLIGEAAARWAARHEDPKQCGSYEDELIKWERDYARKPNGGFRTSYDRLLTWAEKCNVKEAVDEAAAESFTAEEQAPPLSDEELGPKINTITDEEEMRTAPNSHLSDIHVADYFRHATQIGQRVVYVPELKTWLLWKRNHGGWIGDTSTESAVRNLVAQELKRYVNKYSTEWTTAQKTIMMSENKVTKVTRLIGDATARRGDEINQSKFHIQTPDSQTWNVVTGKPIPLRERKLQFDIRYTKVPMAVTDAPCPRFDEIVMQLADGDEDVFEWMWHYFGYCLLGHPRARCFLCIWGPGGNGKSVLVNVLSHIMGSYAVSLDSKVIFQSGDQMHPTSRNRLRYRRLATVSETEKEQNWNEKLIKQMTGGDKIEARNMGKDATDFNCEAGLLVICNDIPRFSKDITPALQQRFRLTGTTKQPAVIDTELDEKIMQWEGSAILRKMMRYAQAVYNGGGSSTSRIQLPEVPLKMQTETSRNLYEHDPFFHWMDTECEYGPQVCDHLEEYEKLKARYERWLDKNNESVLVANDKVDDKEFLKKLEGRGISSTDKSGRKLRKTNRSNGQSMVMVRGVRLKIDEVGAAA